MDLIIGLIMERVNGMKNLLFSKGAGGVSI